MGQKLRFYHFSDSHGSHELLQVPENIDLVIFSGDESNHKDPWMNLPEFNQFIVWYASLDIPWKIFVAGNHSAAIAKGLVKKQDFTDKGIIYLENDYCTIEGLKIFGSPITPTYGNWHFMKARDKMDKFWSNVTDDVDIMVTHGPPKGHLDLSESSDHKLELCGDNALRRHVERIKPLIHCFGHCHSRPPIKNAGILYRDSIYYSNGSVVDDGKFGKLSSNGNIFEIDLTTKKINIL